MDKRQAITLLGGGRVYRGAWSYDAGEVRVEGDCGQRSAPFDGDAHHAQLLAELLFRQMVRNSVWRPGDARSALPEPA